MKWFNNLKMIQKLLSAFITVALFIGIVGIIGIYSMKNMSKDINNIYNIDLIGIDSLENIKANLLLVRLDTLLIIDPNKKSDLQKNVDDMTAIKTRDDALVVAYKPTITNELDKRQFAEFEKLLVDYRVIRDGIIKQAVEGNYAKANELYPNLTKPRADMNLILDKEIKLSTDAAKVDYDNSELLYNKASARIIVITILGLFIAIVFGLIIAITISKNIKKVVTVAEALGENDLSKIVDIDSKDEIGILAKALNKAITNLKMLIKEISEDATDISATSEELSATTEEISAKMDIVNESVRQVSLGAEQLSASTEEVNATTEDIVANVVNVTGKAHKGNKIASDIEVKAKTIRKNAENSSNSSNELYLEKQESI